MDAQWIRDLAPGQVFVDYGPVSMVVSAWEEDIPRTDLCREAFSAVRDVLEEIASQQTILKRYPLAIAPGFLKGAPEVMWKAVLRTEEPTLTPMAAVAGTVADFVADWIAARGATKVIVNNGGDIALRLKPDARVRMGIIADLSRRDVEWILELSGRDPVGGVATSGLGGRSFTRGVASAVTVLAGTCAEADALATHLANISRIPSERVHTCLAGDLDPQSDISDLDVVTGVDALSEGEVGQALSQIRREAERYLACGRLVAVFGCVQSRNVWVPEDFFAARLNSGGVQDGC